MVVVVVIGCGDVDCRDIGGCIKVKSGTERKCKEGLDLFTLIFILVFPQSHQSLRMM